MSKAACLPEQVPRFPGSSFPEGKSEKSQLERPLLLLPHTDAYGSLSTLPSVFLRSSRPMHIS